MAGGMIPEESHLNWRRVQRLKTPVPNWISTNTCVGYLCEGHASPTSLDPFRKPTSVPDLYRQLCHPIHPNEAATHEIAAEVDGHLQSFDCDILHRPGVENVAVDALSRRSDHRSSSPRGRLSMTVVNQSTIYLPPLGKGLC